MEGDFRFDLAWLCALMERSGFPGFAAACKASYEALLGDPVRDFDYFTALATLRWLMNVSVSLRAGESLNQARKGEFASFIAPMIRKAEVRLGEISGVEM